MHYQWEVFSVPCYHPISGFICQDGRFRQWPKESDRERPQTVPCNGCVGCRLQRSSQWAIRVMHEASLYKNNCFINLTYAPEHLPSDYGLHYDHFQLFMKRLRKSFTGLQLVEHPYFGQLDAAGDPYPEFYAPIRFYMCGEYGEQRGRPHFHACLFNFDFVDKRHWRTTDLGHKVFRSAALEELWPFGMSEIGSVTYQSAAYVARYILKKVTGDQADDAYRWVDPNTGEIFDRTPEFTKMSLRPGVAAGWFKKYHADVFPHDRVVVNGRLMKPPRYYDRLYVKHLESLSDPFAPALFDEIQFERYCKAQNFLADNTPERLQVKEQVQLAKLQRLKRTLK